MEDIIYQITASICLLLICVSFVVFLFKVGVKSFKEEAKLRQLKIEKLKKELGKE